MRSLSDLAFREFHIEGYLPFRLTLLIGVLLVASWQSSKAQVALPIEGVNQPPERFVEREDTAVVSVISNGSSSLLVTRRAIYKVDSKLPPQKLSHYRCERIDEKAGKRSVVDEYETFSAATNVSGNWYIASNRGLYEVVDGLVRPIAIDKYCNPSGLEKSDPESPDAHSRDIDSIFQVGERTWVQGSDTLGYIVDGKVLRWNLNSRYTKYAGVSEQAAWFCIQYSNGARLEKALLNQVGLDQTLLKVQFNRESLSTIKGNLKDCSTINGRVWVEANDGVYVVDAGVAYWIGERSEKKSDGILALAASSSDESVGFNRSVDSLSPVDDTVVDTSALYSLLHLPAQQLVEYIGQSFAERQSGWLSRTAKARARLNDIYQKREAEFHRTAPPPTVDLQTRAGITRVPLSQLPIETLVGCVTGEGQYSVLKFEDLDGVYLTDPISNNGNRQLSGSYKSIEVKWSDDDNCSGYMYTDRGAYRLSKNAITLISPLITANTYGQSFAIPIKTTKGIATLFISPSGFFVEQEGSVSRIQELSSRKTRITSIRATAQFDGYYWILTDQGAYIFNEMNITRVPDLPIAFREVRFAGGTFWLTEGNLGPIGEDGSQRWLNGFSSIYRVFPRATVDVTFESISPSDYWKSLVKAVTGKSVTVSGLYSLRFSYVDADGLLIGRLPTSKFDFLASRNTSEYDRLSEGARFSAEEASFDLPAGDYRLLVKARDNYGNVLRIDKELTVVPGAYVVPAAATFSWVLLTLVAFALSPRLLFCQQLIANPSFRKYWSVGVVSAIFLASTRLRNYFLKRYYGSICLDKEFVLANAIYVPSDQAFTFEVFYRVLAEERKIILLGQSGLGKTTFLKWFTYQLALKRSRKVLSKGVIPIYMALSRYRNVSPKDIFRNQLEVYGHIVDSELADSFLRQGGFAIFVDGLNEVDVQQRERLSSFIDAASKANLICVSSQESYPEVGWLRQIDLKPLGDEEVSAILTKSLGAEASSVALQTMSREALEFCRIPQNLDFAVQILRKGTALPPSLFGLYSEMFRPIELRWINANHLDYTNILVQRAFVMVTRRTTFFVEKNFEVPEAIVADLLQERLLVLSGQQISFRHDIIRAYFASIYFTQLWQTKSEVWDAAPDRNWLPMLEFVISKGISSEEIRSLIFRITKANADVAAQLFGWVKGQFPFLIDEQFENDFTMEYGRSSLAAALR